MRNARQFGRQDGKENNTEVTYYYETNKRKL